MRCEFQFGCGDRLALAHGYFVDLEARKVAVHAAGITASDLIAVLRS
jgi:hypothetical protein